MPEGYQTGPPLMLPDGSDSEPDSLISDPEPVFLDLVRSPGIDLQPGGPERQPYLSYRLARLHRLGESIPRNSISGLH